jgi:hypothetical protein
LLWLLNGAAVASEDAAEYDDGAAVAAAAAAAAFARCLGVLRPRTERIGTSTSTSTECRRGRTECRRSRRTE